MRTFLLVLIGGAICYNYTQSVTVSDVFWMTLVQLPVLVIVAWAFEIAGRYSVNHWPWGRRLFYAVLVFYAIVTVMECYLCIFVKSGYTPSILTFLFQTNAGESQGFADAYLTNKMFFLFIVSLVSVLILIWCVELFFPEHMVSRPWLRWVVSLCFIFVLLFPVYPCSSVSRLADSLYDYSQIRHADRNLCYDTKVYSPGTDSTVLVLIIGEAFSKHHSRLYGYPKHTNPCLEKLVQSGNLYPFYDVVAPYNKTHMVLKELLSMHSIDSPKPWNAYPLWPQIFKESGYFVSFVSNQVPKAAPNGSEAYFFQDEEVEQQCFDYRNSCSYRYDEGIFNDLHKISSLCADHKELTILHLNGQHIYATYNFPHDRFTVFRPSDYVPNNLNLDSRQVQEVADYDNATLYNDYVVSSIMRWYDNREAIVVYLSDHGEEVHDYRPFLGRSHESMPTTDVIKYQYEIPFMIYVSDSYIYENPDIVKIIRESQGLRLMSDDLPHMILGLSGIKTGWYDSTRDVLSHDFDQSRARIFGY